MPPTPEASDAPAEALGDHQLMLSGFEARLDGYARRLDDIERRVRSLKDAALGGAIARTTAVILHRNDMGTGFALEEATYALDGATIFQKRTAEGSELDHDFEVFNGPIAPGAHQLQVSLLYRASSLGFFTYLKGYKFKLESKHTFQVEEGRMSTLTVVSFERPDVTRDAAESMAVRFDLDDGSGGAGRAPARGSNAPPGPSEP